jgi:hypothetical protein
VEANGDTLWRIVHPVVRIPGLMALAIHFGRLIREGKVKDYAEIARLGGVTRARTRLRPPEV